MYLLGLSLLIVFWWIGVWGLVETFIQPLIKGSSLKAAIVYGVMILAVLGILVIKPDLLEHFV